MPNYQSDSNVSNFDCGLSVGARQAGLSIAIAVDLISCDFYAQQSLVYL